MTQARPATTVIQVYGTGTCDDTKAVRRKLDFMSVPYEYIDIEAFPAAREWVKEQNKGETRTPTIDVAGRVLSNPSEEELKASLREARLVELL